MDGAVQRAENLVRDSGFVIRGSWSVASARPVFHESRLTVHDSRCPGEIEAPRLRRFFDKVSQFATQTGASMPAAFLRYSSGTRESHERKL
jgi:hypothetical protein